MTKWNYYLQGADIIVRNDYKPLVKFPNGKNTNNKVNRWSLELATYNIIFEWISGTKNKAANCLSQLVEKPPTTTASINMMTATHTDGPAFNTRSPTQQHLSAQDNTAPLNTPPDPSPTPKSLSAEIGRPTTNTQDRLFL